MSTGLSSHTSEGNKLSRSRPLFILSAIAGKVSVGEGLFFFTGCLFALDVFVFLAGVFAAVALRFFLASDFLFFLHSLQIEALLSSGTSNSFLQVLQIISLVSGITYDPLLFSICYLLT
jgi:hypothetical protein